MAILVDWYIIILQLVNVFNRRDDNKYARKIQNNR